MYLHIGFLNLKRKRNSYFLAILWFACFLQGTWWVFFPLSIRWHGMINLKQRNANWRQLGVSIWILHFCNIWILQLFGCFILHVVKLDQGWVWGAAPYVRSTVRAWHCRILVQSWAPHPSPWRFGFFSCIWGKKVRSWCLFSTWHVCWAAIRAPVSSNCAGAICDVCAYVCVHYEHHWDQLLSYFGCYFYVKYLVSFWSLVDLVQYFVCSKSYRHRLEWLQYLFCLDGELYLFENVAMLFVTASWSLHLIVLSLIYSQDCNPKTIQGCS